MKQDTNQASSSPSTHREYAPYVSAIITSRNDDHGGDMYGRMRTCFLGIIEQAEKHRVPSELIIVDWNPPPGRPLLKDIFSWPTETSYCTVRSIVVPPGVHNEYAHANAKPVHPVAAQNVGIRRSRGKFILSATADLLFRDEFFAFLAEGELQHDRYYRADRIDVAREVTQLGTFREQLQYAEAHALRIYTEFGAMELSPGTTRLPHSRVGVRSVRPGPRGPLPLLHTNAPDLFLMSRTLFDRIHGWPDVGLTGIHGDGLLCYLAVAAGAVQEVLPTAMDVYHIDHGSDWKAQPSLLRSLIRKYRPKSEFVRRATSSLYWGLKRAEQPVSAVGIPYLSGYSYRRFCRDIYHQRRSYAWNDDSWGLKDQRLEEHIIVRSHLEENAPK